MNAEDFVERVKNDCRHRANTSMGCKTCRGNYWLYPGKVCPTCAGRELIASYDARHCIIRDIDA